MRLAASGSLSLLGGTLTVAGSSAFSGPAAINGGLVALQGDSIFNSGVQINGGVLSISGNISGAGTLTNAGTLDVAAGTGTVTIGIPFSDQGGVIDVTSGTLAFANDGGSSTGGSFLVQSGATVLLNHFGAMSGDYDGTGGGVVALTGNQIVIGPGGAAFDFAPQVFQWGGGNINLNGQTLTNTGTITLANAGGVALVSGGSLINQGTIDVTGAGGLGFANGSLLDNQASGLLNFQADAGTYDAGWGGTLTNEGTLEKTGGTGTSRLAGIGFGNSGTIDVQSGTLTNAAGGISTGGVFTVAQGAMLDLTGGTNVYYQGNYTGSGGGVISLGNGTLYLAANASFDFPGSMFQWSGGNLDPYGHTLTNVGVITLSNGGGVDLAGGGTLVNQGTIDVTGTGGPARSSTSSRTPASTTRAGRERSPTRARWRRPAARAFPVWRASVLSTAARSTSSRAVWPTPQVGRARAASSPWPKGRRST